MSFSCLTNWSIKNLPFYNNLPHRFVGKFVKKSDRILPGTDPKYTNLYVKNLDPDVTEEVLEDKFSEFGKVLSLVISKDDNGDSRGFGFVNFESTDDARRAMEAMNGSQLGIYYCYGFSLESFCVSCYNFLVFLGMF